MGRLPIYFAILFHCASLTGIMALESERMVANAPGTGQPNIVGQIVNKQNSGIANPTGHGSQNAFVRMPKNYGKRKQSKHAARNKKTDVPIYDLQPNYDLEFGDCAGFDILAFNSTEFAGQKMDDPHECAETCNSLPECKLFLWLKAPEFDGPLCLPKNFVCDKQQHGGDPNYMLFIKKKPNAELIKQQQTFILSPPAPDNSIAGYRKEANCRIYELGNDNADQTLKTLEVCAQLCNGFADCDAFVWRAAAADERQGRGVCRLRRWQCPPSEEVTAAEPGFMYIKEAIYSKLQRDAPSQQPPRSLGTAGYRKELNCRSYDLGASGADQKVITGEGCAQLCNGLADCDAFVWRTTAGVCRLRRWKCPPSDEVMGKPGNMYIKEATFSKLQRDAPLQPPPRSLQCKDAYFTCPEDDPTSTSFRPPLPPPHGWQRLPLAGPGQIAERQPSMQGEPVKFEKRMRQKEQGNKLVQKT